MKTFLQQVLLIAAAASAITAVGYAQAAIPGTEQSLTLAITITSNARGTFLKDDTGKTVVPKQPVMFNEWSKMNANGVVIQTNTEHVSKYLSTKFSNKEFLQALVDIGMIESISGWSLKRVNNKINYITKGTQAINLDEFLDMNYDNYAWALAGTFTSVRKFDDDGEQTSYTEAGFGTYKEWKKLKIKVSTWEINVQGISVHSVTAKKVGAQYLYPSKGLKMNLAGSYTSPDADIPSIAEGTLTGAAEKTLPDISQLYPDAV